MDKRPHKALEIRMRDVMDGLEELACLLAYHHTALEWELLPDAPPVSRPSARVIPFPVRSTQRTADSTYTKNNSKIIIL